jgi:NADH-quinone oxidoreductase subunit N
MPININDLYTVLPVTIVVVWACVLLLVDLFWLQQRKGVTAVLAAAGLALAFGFTLALARNDLTGFTGMAVLDGYAIYFNALFCATGILAVMLAYDYLRRMNIERGEYYPMILFSVAGMMLMAQATDLIVVFLALELLSIPLYVLAAFAYPRLDSLCMARRWSSARPPAPGFSPSSMPSAVGMPTSPCSWRALPLSWSAWASRLPLSPSTCGPRTSTRARPQR